MPDDESLIVMEPDDGAVPSLTPAPVETPPAAPVVAATETPVVPAVVPETPPVVPPEAPEPDPRVRGILADLTRERETVRQLRESANLGLTLARQLHGRPDIMALLQTPPNGQSPAPPAPPAPAEPVGPPAHELREMAESLSLYTPEGKPDLDAAKRVYGYTSQIATAAAESAVTKHVRPIEQRQLQDQAGQRTTEAQQVATQYGVEADVFSRAVGSLPADVLATSEGATLATLVAIGLQQIKAKHGALPGAVLPAPPAPPAVVPPVAAAPAPPVFTEPSGGRTVAPVMSEAEIKLAKKVGVKAAEWQQTAARFAQQPTAKSFPMEEDE